MKNSFKQVIPALKSTASKTALVAGIIAAGSAAHAATPNGSLNFSDGVGDFFAQVGGAISVTFSPAGFAIAGGSGAFNPQFTTLSTPIGISPLTIGLTCIGVCPTGANATGIYTISSGGGGFTFANGVNVSLTSGDEFGYVFNPTGSGVQFELIGNNTATVTGLTGFGPSSTQDVTFQFSDTSQVGGAAYNGVLQFESVPGPLPLLGAGAAFGFSRKLRSRIKKSTVAV